MTGIVVTVTETEPRITSPFEARTLIKQIPGRKWDAVRKIWIAPPWALDETRAILANWPGGFRIINPTATPRAGKNQNWAESMFDDMRPDLQKRVYRALAGVLHPDHGGELRQMQKLSIAWTRARNR